MRDIEVVLSKIYEEKSMTFIKDDPEGKTVTMGKEIPHFSICDLVVKD